MVQYLDISIPTAPQTTVYPGDCLNNTVHHIMIQLLMFSFFLFSRERINWI